MKIVIFNFLAVVGGCLFCATQSQLVGIATNFVCVAGIFFSE